MKLMIYLGAGIGGIIGGYIPALLWHDGMLSGWSLLFGFVGTTLVAGQDTKLVRWLSDDGGESGIAHDNQCTEVPSGN